MSDMNSYDTEASGQVQATVKKLSGQILSLIQAHEKNVGDAAKKAQADGVMEEYVAKESKFNEAANATVRLIDALKTTMEKNDGIASTTLKTARGHVDNIG
jgi:hypothetical protein